MLLLCYIDLTNRWILNFNIRILCIILLKLKILLECLFLMWILLIGKLLCLHLTFIFLTWLSVILFIVLPLRRRNYFLIEISACMFSLILILSKLILLLLFINLILFNFFMRLFILILIIFNYRLTELVLI